MSIQSIAKVVVGVLVGLPIAVVFLVNYLDLIYGIAVYSGMPGEAAAFLVVSIGFILFVIALLGMIWALTVLIDQGRRPWEDEE